MTDNYKSAYKLKISIIAIVTVFAVLSSSCTALKFPVRLYGLIDTEGNYLVEPVFTGIQVGKEGMYAIRMGADEYYKWGYCNVHGEIIIEPQYLDASMFTDDVAPVRLFDGDQLWVFIDKRNNIVFDKRFNYALPFSEGLACVQSAERNKTYKLWGFIDMTGEYVIEPQYEISASFSEGLAKFQQGSAGAGLCGYINKSGEIVIEPQFSYAGLFSDGLASVKLSLDPETNDAGFIDKNGDIVVPLEYYNTSTFGDGLAPVLYGETYKDALYGYIDINNNIVIKPKYYMAYSFSEGLAAVKTDYYDNSGWMYIDTTGKLVIKNDFSSASSFIDGVAPVSMVEYQ